MDVTLSTPTFGDTESTDAAIAEVKAKIAECGEPEGSAARAASPPALKPRAPQVLRSAQAPAQLCFQFSRI